VLAQIGMAFWPMLAGTGSLMIGLTGIAFGWHRRTSGRNPAHSLPGPYFARNRSIKHA
jgi:hypothetical protein